MTNTIYKYLSIFCFSLCVSCNYAPITPFVEIPDPDLKEIAMIRADPHWGSVVIYNPDTCMEIGEACGFFRLHAYAHKHLNHTLLAEPKDYPLSLETQADCWAAQYGKPNEINAAIALLKEKNRNPTWRIHGNDINRAENIQACALKAGKLVEN